LRQDLGAAEDGLGRLQRAPDEAVELAAVDRLAERRARVAAPEGAVVGAPVRGAERGPETLVGVGLRIATPPERGDPVAELLEEVLVAQAARPDERRALRERVDRDVVEALVLHALRDRGLDPTLAGEEAP